MKTDKEIAVLRFMKSKKSVGNTFVTGHIRLHRSSFTDKYVLPS